MPLQPVPTSADPHGIVDVPKQLQAQQDLTKGQEDLDQQRKDRQQAAADEMAMRSYAQVGDMHSPEGLDQTLKDMQGRISTKAYLGLAAHAQQVKQQAIQYQEHLSKLDENQVQQESAASAAMANALAPLLEGVHSPEEFKVKQQAVLANMSGLMRADGKTPRYSPQALQQVANMDSDALMMLAKTSGNRAQVAKIAHEEQATKTAMAQEEAARARAEGKTEAWKGPNGETLERSQNGNLVMQIDPESGQSKVLPALPPGSVRIDATGSGAGKAALAQVPPLRPEVAQFFAEYSQSTGKPYPGIPAGTGAGGALTRSIYLNSVYEQAKQKGYTGSQAGELAFERDTTKKVITDLKGKNAVTEAGEKNLEKVGARVVAELEKLGGPDSPVVRNAWKRTSGDLMGDPKFAALGTAMTDYIESAARVYSGQTGAGGTPVTYLDLAEKSIGTKTPNLGQFQAVTTMLHGLAEDRRASYSETIKDLTESVRMKDKPGAETSVPATQRVEPSLTPEEMRAELKTAREKFRTATDDKQKTLASQVVTDLEKKLKTTEKPKAMTEAEVRAKYGL